MLISGNIGSGKSTLLRTILKGFIPGQIETISGNCEIMGTTAMVLQRIKSQILTFSVEEEISTSLSYKKIPRQLRKEMVKNLVREFDFEDYIQRDPRLLSSGEQQITVILAALIQKPDILLLDEPFSMLDHENSQKLYSFLMKLKTNNTTIVITHHHPERISSLIDLHLKLADGMVTYLGPISKNTFQSQSYGNIENYENSNPVHYTIDIDIGYTKFIKKINLKIPNKGLILIKGKNGSGKTCLLLTLSGIINPIKGKISLETHNIFLPQDTYNFFWEKDVQQVIGQNNIPVWLNSMLDKSPFVLSEGQRKKLALEVIFRSESDCLILDEPSQALDIETSMWIVNSIIQHSKLKLIIISSNDLFFINQISRYANMIMEL